MYKSYKEGNDKWLPPTIFVPFPPEHPAIDKE
jgi:hypothetical protein